MSSSAPTQGHNYYGQGSTLSRTLPWSLPTAAEGTPHGGFRDHLQVSSLEPGLRIVLRSESLGNQLPEQEYTPLVMDRGQELV